MSGWIQATMQQNTIDLKSMIQAKKYELKINWFYHVHFTFCVYHLEKLAIKIILLLLFSGHSQDESQSDGPEIEQAPVQPQ